MFEVFNTAARINHIEYVVGKGQIMPVGDDIQVIVSANVGLARF
jgi:hypothetical protein